MQRLVGGDASEYICELLLDESDNDSVRASQWFFARKSAEEKTLCKLKNEAAWTKALLLEQERSQMVFGLQKVLKKACKLLPSVEEILWAAAESEKASASEKIESDSKEKDRKKKEGG